ncbi:ISXO2-like transposase domain-containing protein [Polaromonas sp. OV174]|nr:ISXO2-like transposase domain-containing protein [Polaromonas sp. OV174]
MLLREAARRLDERVEIDDAYLGGERAGHIHGGRGPYGKSAFVAAVQTWPDGRPRWMRLTPIAGFSNDTLQDWARQNLAPTAHVVSDGLRAFAQVLQAGATHEHHVLEGGRQAAKTPQLCWVNTMLGNLKTAQAGIYHSFDHAKYAARYLAEFAYRFSIAALIWRPSLLCDSGYVGQPFAQGVKDILGEHVTVQIAKRSELHTFKVMPKR